VSSEELLGARESVPDDESRTEGEENVFVVGVQDQSAIDLTLKANNRREIKFLFQSLCFHY
jgi:hypothetical protein